MLIACVWSVQGSLLTELQRLMVINVLLVLLIVGIAAVVTVVVVRRSMRQKVEAERLAAMGTATARILHQVKNPLQSIVLHAELLAEHAANGAADAVRREASEAVLASANQMTELVEDLSAYASGVERRLTREPLDLGALVRDVAGREFAVAEHAGIRTRMEVEDGVMVEGDAYYLRHALDNVIRNAEEALAEREGPRGRRLEVRLRTQGRSAVIEVEDNGSGIAPGRVEEVVRPFVSTKGDGMGLGLAICSDIMAGHGGRIEIDSTSGGGTQVALVLPAATLPADQPA